MSDERKREYEAFYIPDTRAPALFDIVYDHENNPRAQNDALTLLQSLGITSRDGACPSGRFSYTWSRNKDGTSVKSGKPSEAWEFRKVLLHWCIDLVLQHPKTLTLLFPVLAVMITPL